MAFIVLFAIPVLLGAVGFIFSKAITWKEFLIQVAAQAVVASISVGVVYWDNTDDTEILNGTVTSKEQESVRCSHSYDCNCRNVPRYCTDKKGHRSRCGTRRKCDTCYEHTNDWNWDVNSSVGSFTISRIDRRGSSEPPRWSAVRIGDPVSVTHSYTNYIKASPGSVFRHSGIAEKYTKFIPEYPKAIHDYYRLNRVVLVNGAQVPDSGAWNTSLSELNGKLGAARQVNMVVVIAKNLPDEFYYALEESWIGGKKNDAVLVIGVGSDLRPQWATVMAWSVNKLFEVKLRDDIMDLPTLTKDGVINALDRNVSGYYKRKPMADFEYLAAAITPSTTQWVVTLILGLMVAIGLVWLMHHHDVFDEEHPRKRPF